MTQRSIDDLLNPHLEPEQFLDAGDVVEINSVVGATGATDYLTFTVTVRKAIAWTVGTVVRFTHPRYGLEDGENLILCGVTNHGDRAATLSLRGLRWKRRDLERNPSLPADERAALAKLEAEEPEPAQELEIPRSRRPQVVGPEQITSGVRIEPLVGEPSKRIVHVSVRLQALMWKVGTPVRLTFPGHGLETGADTTLLSATFDLMDGRSDLRLLWVSDTPAEN